MFNKPKEKYTPLKSNTFEDQLNNKEKVAVLDADIEVVDISPEEPKTDVPTIFTPGLGENLEVLENSMWELYQRDRRVLSLTHEEYDIEAPEEYPEEEFKKALAILETLDSKGIDQIDGVAHSEGAINLCLAAKLAPEKFRNIVLINPAGMMGEEKFSKLAVRFLHHVANINMGIKWKKFQKSLQKMLNAEGDLAKKDPDILVEDVVKSKLDAVHEYGKKHPFKGLREARGIAATNLHEILESIHNEGIGVAVIHGADDPLFPMEKVQEMTDAENIDGFYSVEGGHSEFYVQADKFMKLVDTALDNLEKKHKKGGKKAA